MGGKQADVPQWTETGAEQRREERWETSLMLMLLMLLTGCGFFFYGEREKVVSSSLPPPAGKSRKSNGLGKSCIVPPPSYSNVLVRIYALSPFIVASSMSSVCALSAPQLMWCFLSSTCAGDCGSEQPEKKHAGLHTAKWEQMQQDILGF